jgi:hypothetical protein
VTDTKSSEVQFLNVDLDVRSPTSLQPLIDDLGEDVIVLHSGEVHGHYIATFASRGSGDANELIGALCRLVENLATDARRTWDEAFSKVFDVGYQAGNGPTSYESTLRPETVAAVAGVGGALRVTVYPPPSARGRKGETGAG